MLKINGKILSHTTIRPSHSCKSPVHNEKRKILIYYKTNLYFIILVKASFNCFNEVSLGLIATT